MVRIVLNEREYAEQLISDNNAPLKWGTLIHVAVYYYAQGYSQKDVSRLLEEFILRRDSKARIEKWRDMIDKCATVAKTRSLIDISGIPITAKELKTIHAIDGSIRQRTMFTLLCLAKYFAMVNPKNNYWINLDRKEIFAISGMVIGVKLRDWTVYDLCQLGLIEQSSIVDNTNIHVLMVDKDGEPVLTVTDFRNLGAQYMSLSTPKAYMHCACCGLLFKRTGARQRYCKDCAVSIASMRRREQVRQNEAADETPA